MSNKKVKLELSASHKYLPAYSSCTIHLMLKIIQPKVILDNSRLPLNISFVLDRSGSMHGAKLDYTKKAVQFAVRNLDSIDRVSLVIFDNQVELPIPSTTAEVKDQLAQLIENIYARGNTNLSGGLLEGVTQVKSAYQKELVNRVILLTDGLANEGITRTDQLVNLVKEIYTGGIGVSTLGVGDDFNEDLLVAMAEVGNGNFYYIETPDTIPEIFKNELEGLLSVTGQNPFLQITPTTETKVNAVFGYEPTWNEGALVKLPDIYNGDTKTVLIELQVKTGAPGMIPLAGIGFSYFDVTAALAQVTFNLDVRLEATTDEELAKTGIDLRVKKEIVLFNAAQAREEALREADRGNYDNAKNILLRQNSKLQKLYEESGDNEIRFQMRQINDEASGLSPVLYSKASRKVIKDASYQVRKKR